MRDILRTALQALPPMTEPFYHHALAYGAWAPIGADGKVPDDQRAGWLSDLANRPVSPDYARAFERWRSSFGAPGDRVRERALASRLLVGHGNPSATDVGLTLHHTWGVPVIPGSSLKGLLAHYMDAVYGPDGALDGERVRYQGVTWEGRRIRRGPGDIYRALFGAPDADDDRELRERGIPAGASRGLVAFHDALYVPGSIDGDAPFAVDVLTVHQKGYYNSSGANWPNDHDDPNPVPFLTVRPGARMLVALSGPADWTELAEQLLGDALRAWGVGGKTSSGYGRLVEPGEGSVGRVEAATRESAARAVAHPAGPGYKSGAKITVTRIEDPSGRGKIKFRADDGVVGHFVSGAPAVVVGATIQVWVANVGGGTYTFTTQPPKGKSR